MKQSIELKNAFSVREVNLEIFDRGNGRALVFLGPGLGIDREAVALNALSRDFRVIAPSHPGFGLSDLPASFTTVDDLAYFYLDMLEEKQLSEVILVGVSFGAWIAVEMAIKSSDRLSHLVMANAVGIKVSDRQTRDIADIFAMTEDQYNAAAFANESVGAKDYKAMSEDDLRAVARNRESLARFVWSPYMHDPKLKQRLHRVSVPTLFLWGAQDNIVSPAYGQAYASAIPGAKFELIDAAGHLPNIEQPEQFASRIREFAGKRLAKTVAGGKS